MTATLDTIPASSACDASSVWRERACGVLEALVIEPGGAMEADGERRPSGRGCAELHGTGQRHT